VIFVRVVLCLGSEDTQKRQENLAEHRRGGSSTR
jgi:hypothetical protein